VILLLAILVVWLATISSPWAIVILAVACVLEAVEILLLRRWARRLDRRTKPTTGAEGMVGEEARVVEACRPEGAVHIHGELWHARCMAGADEGDTVHVVAIEGLTLVVAP
jgi:membrane-bound serine protease (ClpP class)